MTLEQSLKALKAAFTTKSGEAEALSKQISKLKEENAALVAAASAAEKELEKLSAVSAERDEAVSKLSELTAKLAEAEKQKAQAVEQIESVGKKSASIAASVGVTPVEISASDAVANKSPEEVWNEYIAIKDPSQKVAFYNKNRTQIMAHLGIK